MKRWGRGLAAVAGLAGAVAACGEGGGGGAGAASGADEATGACADGDTGCDRDEAISLSCPRLADLRRVCVPLPGSGLAPTTVSPGGSCGRGFVSPAKADVRRLSRDTILIKEVGDPTGERPVMTLFLGAERALLLDAGNNSLAVESLVAPLVGARPVELINTHLHGDHIGRNSKFNVIAVATPEVEAHCRVRGFDANASAPCANADPYEPPDDQELFSFRSFRVARVVRDGHKIDLGGGRVLTVLATPGHSETSITVVDPARRLVFTGDSLYPGDDPALVHPKGSSLARYVETAQRYRGLQAGADVVVGAHGEGLMPARSLSAFASFVAARAQNPNGPRAFSDPQGCPSGDFVMGNDPARP